jgi:16S rRNA (cytidine1402-2'-O)-methyltransferase
VSRPVETSGRGRLVLVATPIGNLGDLSPRAVAALADADVVACEDTRRSGRLLSAAGVTARRLVVVNDHTERAAADELVGIIRRGGVVALITDAGTPGIADPGERLVAAVVDAGLEVDVVPGPSSPVAALVLSGLPAGRFVMEGFLPRRGPERAARLAEIAAERRTSVILEAPHRVVRTVEDLAGVCGPARRVALCRELTKLHQEVWRGSLGDAAGHLDEVAPRGEYVLVLDGAPPPDGPSDAELTAALAAEREAGASTRDAVDRVATASGASRRRVYALAVGGSPPGASGPDHPGAGSGERTGE